MLPNYLILLLLICAASMLGKIITAAIAVFPNVEGLGQRLGVPLVRVSVAAARTALAAHIVRNKPPHLGSLFLGHIIYL